MTSLRPINQAVISCFQSRLEQHPIYQAVQTLDDLRCFMEHHVYSVWDFMSLIKELQGILAPAKSPWLPMGDGAVRRFINELVLEEESDATNQEGEFSSHLELYIRAMREIGANPEPFLDFLDTVQLRGIEQALALPSVPAPSRQFTQQTFAFIQSNQAHQVAAALALGREHIIPAMFRAILQKTGVTPEQAPTFHFYLNRHIHLDEDFHAPLSLRLLNNLCADDDLKYQQAITAAQVAIKARLNLWDGILKALI